MTQHKGYYNSAGTMSSYEATEDGGLMIHGVIIMAAGTWTDMHGIKTTFSPEVLQACATQWADNAVWTRHAGGTPRSVTEKVGAVLNPTYSPTEYAVIADVFLHNQTDASRACASLVQMAREAGGIKDVSAETIVDIDRDGNVQDVTFTGLALVEDGACETCRLPAYSAQEDNDMAEEEPKQETTEVETKTEETETKTEAPKDNDDLLDMLAGFVAGIIPDTKEIIEGIREAEGEDRVRALGRLEGCMQAWGYPTVAEEYSKAMNDALAQFEKSIDEKLASIQNEVAQYSKPAGLKGKAGADKDQGTERQTLTLYGSGRTALY